MPLVVGLAVIFSAVVEVEAADIYVGTSEATGWECYVDTDSIYRVDDTTHVTLKMVTQRGDLRYLDYDFWYDPQRDVMRFANSEGYSGIANRYETPIEWQILQVIRQY